MAKSLIDRGARLSDKLALAILPACCVEGVFARAYPELYLGMICLELAIPNLAIMTWNSCVLTPQSS